MLDFFHSNGLRRSTFVRFYWTNGEISKQCGLSISARAIEILTDQVNRFFVRRGEDVMSTDVPYREKTIASVPDCSAMNLEAILRQQG